MGKWNVPALSDKGGNVGKKARSGGGQTEASEKKKKAGGQEKWH